MGIRSISEISLDETLDSTIYVGLLAMTFLVPLAFVPFLYSYEITKLVIVEVSAITLTVVWVIRMALSREIKVIDTPIYFTLLGFLAVNFVSLFQANNVLQGFETLFQYFCYFF